MSGKKLSREMMRKHERRLKRLIRKRRGPYSNSIHFLKLKLSNPRISPSFTGMSILEKTPETIYRACMMLVVTLLFETVIKLTFWPKVSKRLLMLLNRMMYQIPIVQKRSRPWLRMYGFSRMTFLSF